MSWHSVGCGLRRAGQNTDPGFVVNIPRFFPHYTDTCLSGFTQTLPKLEDWNRYATLHPEGRSWRTYLFPSLRFACEGRLERLEFVPGAMSSVYWNINVVGLYLSVWRPDGIGYIQVASQEFRITNAQSTWTSPLVINLSTDVGEGYIVGVTLPPSTPIRINSQWFRGIPLRMFTTAQPYAYSIGNDSFSCFTFVSTPLIKASFIPSSGKRHSSCMICMHIV